MKNNKGAISLFALLAMMFFLIFVMVAYNNIALKSKTQVQTEEVLYKYYQSTQTAADCAKSKIVTDTNEVNENKSKYFEYGKPLDVANNPPSSTKYIISHGKVYQIK